MSLFTPAPSSFVPMHYRSDKPSRAVVAHGGMGNGCLLHWVGIHLEVESEAGFTSLDDLGLDDAPEGISIWEGKYTWSSGVNGEGIDEGGDAAPDGEFRALTDAEWAAIRENKAPWDEADWESPEYKEFQALEFHREKLVASLKVPQERPGDDDPRMQDLNDDSAQDEGDI